MLQIFNLKKKYGTTEEIIALDNVSLKIKAGEFIAIMGKSGSGKTTLLNMIGGLDKPDNGSIMFEGMNIVELSGKRSVMLRRQKIGIIYQFYNLIPELSVSENITLPTELDGGNIDQEWLLEILHTIGLDGRENAYPGILSGGQQQRVAIARAIFNKPSLILADEPTGNLDGESAREVLALLVSMNDKYGVTVLVVTHSDEVASEAKRVITIANGKVMSDRRK